MEKGPETWASGERTQQTRASVTAQEGSLPVKPGLPGYSFHLSVDLSVFVFLLSSCSWSRGPSAWRGPETTQHLQQWRRPLVTAQERQGHSL